MERIQSDQSSHDLHIDPPVPVPIVNSPESEDEEKVVPIDGTVPAGEVPDGQGEDKVEMIDGRPKDMYDRFTKSQKNRIVAIVSYSALLSPVTSSVFLPSIPQMAVDLNTTASVINYTVAIFLITIGTAPLIWSPLSGFYGRKPVYLASMPIHVIASIGVARSNSVGAIIGTRILQGIGGSCVLAVGAGSIGDIYRPTERANAMGWFYSGALMGPSFSPLIAGLLTEYTAQTWRSCQYLLAGAGALSVILTFFFLPETSQRPLPHDVLKEERGKKFVFYWFNPFTSLGLFAWKNICAISFVSSCVMLETYCFVVPLSTVFRSQYGIVNVAIAGCLYIPQGGGNFIGARIAGPLCDRTVAKFTAKRGYRRPEDRLRASLIGGGIIMPLACITYGWLIQYSAGGLAPPIIMMFLSGIALMMVLTPCNTYLIDSMQKRSAEVIAVNNFVRYIFAAAASAFVLPMAKGIGWGLTMTIAAIISWLATASILLTLRYGHIWREKANARHGIEVAADELHPPKEARDEEGSSPTPLDPPEEGKSQDEAEEPGHLVPAPAIRAGCKGVKAKEVQARPVLSRHSTRNEMPNMQEVLKRTVSLSGASVHGN